MRLTIICEDKWVSEVREKAKSVCNTHLPMNIPASKTGELPVTHWVCVGYFTNDGVKKILNLQNHTIITTDYPKKKLEELELKIIN